MDDPILTDKEQVPTEDMIFSHIGGSRIHWESIFGHIRKEHPEFVSEWRYYKDGGSWLLKTTRKKKTIFWLSVVKDSFMITFYFGDKAEPAILASGIAPALKDSFKTGKRNGKIRGITVDVDDAADVDNVRQLIDVKLSIK